MGLGLAIGKFLPQCTDALATVVGVLVEVAVMLILVRIANNSIKELPQ